MTSSPTSQYRIREAVITDAEAILQLIHGLAVYEKAPEEVSNTVEQLREDGWGKTPRFQAFMGEVLVENCYHSVGFALTFFAYSTWKGNCLYLEDVYVEPEYRGRGIGLALMKHCIFFAHSQHCHRVMWSALDWNTPAIDFYIEKIGAIHMKEWISLRLTEEGIQQFVDKFNNNKLEQSPTSSLS